MQGSAMSAVASAIPAASHAAVQAIRSTPGITVTERLAGQQALLPAGALALLVSLHRAVEPERQARLAARRQRQAFFDGGGLPDFRADTAAIREGDWQVAALPAALQVGPAYGLAVLRGARPGAEDLALFILGRDGQRILARYGFTPVTLP